VIEGVSRVDEHAEAAKSAIINAEGAAINLAAVKRILERRERELREGIEGRNTQEREDELARRLDNDPEYQRLLVEANAHRIRRAECEGEAEYQKLMARAHIAALQAAGAR
jgi:hypothetical protein